MTHAILFIQPDDGLLAMAQQVFHPLVSLWVAPGIPEALGLIDRHQPALVVSSVGHAMALSADAALSGRDKLPMLLLTVSSDDWVLASQVSVPHDVLFVPSDQLTMRYRIMKHLPHPLLRVVALVASDAWAGIQQGLEAYGVACHVIKNDQLLPDAMATYAPSVLLLDSDIPALNQASALSLAAKAQLPVIGMIGPDVSARQLAFVSACQEFVSPSVGMSEWLYRICQVSHSSFPLSTPKDNHRTVPTREGAFSPLSDVVVTLQHEINSPLTGIKMGAQTLAKRLGQPEQVLAREIEASAKRIESTLGRLQSAQRLGQEVYLNGTTMAVFDTEPLPWA
ncbi:hypothetical protein EBZ35_04830 [bacterium]|nr:hypothetical protein [bacterium]